MQVHPIQVSYSHKQQILGNIAKFRNALSAEHRKKDDLELHVVVIIHRMRTKFSAAEIAAAAATAAAITASNKATNEDCSLHYTQTHAHMVLFFFTSKTWHLLKFFSTSTNSSVPLNL